MKRISIKAFDIPDAYRQVLNAIWYQGDKFVVGYGSEEKETMKIHTSIEISHPENRPLVDDKAPCDMKYIQEYALTYLWIPQDKDNTSTYTYGGRLRAPIDQIQEIINRFIQERNDRQCTAVIRRPEDIYKFLSQKTIESEIVSGDTLIPFEMPKKHDPPCLTMLDYEILDGKLICEAYFRSWDAYAGLPANIAGIQLTNEAIAKEIGIETGSLILHSKNVHIYERQYKLVQELVESKTTKPVDVAAMVRVMKNNNV